MMFSDPPAEVVLRLAVQDRNVVAVLQQLLHQQPADEESPPDDQYFHRSSQTLRRAGARTRFRPGARVFQTDTAISRNIPGPGA